MREINGYQIFAELKRGPVTTIFKALDIRHQQIVLIKRLHAEAAVEAHRRLQFLQESKVSTRLAHPNLRRLLNSGVVGDEPFLVLEYVEGPTLAELIARHKKLPIDLCLFIAKELAKAIAAVHRNNFLHRDIKPQNIFLSLNGEVKLGDLGLAHELSEIDPAIAGTPAYMSPEQVLGREITVASDLFAFGAVLYEMLTGEAAFANRTLAATLHHVANWEPVPISKLRPEAHNELVAVCQKLLAKNPSERYAGAEAVLTHLTRLERAYGLTTTKYQLAAFLESPETYRKITLPQAVTIVEGDAIPKPRKSPWVNWEITAVVSATMFLAGVLFIWGIKENVEQKVKADKTAGAVIPLLHPTPGSAQNGYLDLRVSPRDTHGVVSINGAAVRTLPLSEPIELPAGRHQISIDHPQLGVRKIRVAIAAGDTLHQEVDFVKP
jgi:serine/threonine protein kinase